MRTHLISLVALLASLLLAFNYIVAEEVREDAFGRSLIIRDQGMLLYELNDPVRYSINALEIWFKDQNANHDLGNGLRFEEDLVSSEDMFKSIAFSEDRDSFQIVLGPSDKRTDGALVTAAIIAEIEDKGSGEIRSYQLPYALLISTLVGLVDFNEDLQALGDVQEKTLPPPCPPCPEQELEHARQI